VLDPSRPLTIGALVGPEAFTEVKVLAHRKTLRALDVLPRLAAEFEQGTGRRAGELLRPYRTEDAETVVVALGSVHGTIQEAVDAMRADGLPVGSLGVCAFRPFPFEAVRAVLARASRVVVLEKNLSIGMGGVMAVDVREALGGAAPPVHAVVAGLGGRPITRASIRRAVEQAHRGALEAVHVLDLDTGVIERELARQELR